MVDSPFKRSLFKTCKNSPFSRLISAIIIVLMVWAFSAGMEKLTGYDILGGLYGSDKSGSSGVDKRSSNASGPPGPFFGAPTRTEAVLRERNFYHGLISRVIDGDTVEVRRRGGAAFRVRLYGSDAPETKKPDEHGGQPFGEEAFAALRNKVEGKRVDVEVVDIDIYGRAVGIVRQGGRDINIEMVSDGLAECYLEYLEGTRKKECAEAEALAKQLKKGMWVLKNYERPNDFRKRMRLEARH
ncbi:MAG: thermonuclease family protein [Thermodesulfobacteriota bacterium]